MGYGPNMGGSGGISDAMPGGAAGGALAGLLGAGSGGIGALLLPLLSSFGPALISKLFGGQSPQEKLRSQAMGLLAPQNMSKLTNQYFQQNVGSPAYSQGQGAIAAGANQTANDVGANLAARGIGNSGTGAVLSGLTPSLVGSQMAGLRTGAYNQAQGQAQNTIQQQLQTLMGTAGPTQNMSLFGAGLSAFSPFLQHFLAAKNPGMFGNASPGGQFQYPGSQQFQ